MEKHERTPWGFAFVLILAAVLGLSFLMPWWEYEYSSGVRTQPGGLQPSNDTRILREHLEIYPFRSTGHSNNTTAEALEQTTGRLGWFVAGSLIVAVLIAALEVPVPYFMSTRWITMILAPIGLGLSVASLWYCWYVVPDLFAHVGVDSAFTTRPTPDGFVRTYITWGWVFPFVASLIYPAVFLFKFQAGATDPTVIEAYQMHKT